MEGRLRTRVALHAKVRVPVSDWEHAIRAVCAPLVEAGAITENYADRCVEIVHEQGPYIVVAPGIALAHARPEDGARELALGAITLAEPVAFGHPSNDPVNLVLVFASPDKEAHVGLLASLARHLTQGLGERLLAAASDAAATARLQEVVDDVGP
ncbi:MAG: PTS sugar transporter subunit IIA [Actinomycetota bacterium]